jgi:hypothetical protein
MVVFLFSKMVYKSIKMNKKSKLIRVTTVPLSLDKLIGGQMGFMKNSFEVIGMSSDLNSLKKIAIEEGVRIACIPLNRKITPIKDLFALLKMFFFLRNEKPFIIHTHTPKAGIIGMLAAKCAGGIEDIEGVSIAETNNVMSLANALQISLEQNTESNRIGFDKNLKERSIENFIKKMELHLSTHD